jgi:hypothetical protein
MHAQRLRERKLFWLWWSRSKQSMKLMASDIEGLFCCIKICELKQLVLLHYIFQKASPHILPLVNFRKKKHILPLVFFSSDSEVQICWLDDRDKVNLLYSRAQRRHHHLRACQTFNCVEIYLDSSLFFYLKSLGNYFCVTDSSLGGKYQLT